MPVSAPDFESPWLLSYRRQSFVCAVTAPQRVNLRRVAPRRESGPGQVKIESVIRVRRQAGAEQFAPLFVGEFRREEFFVDE